MIDDEALVRWAIRQTLDPAFYEIHEAADGKSAISVLAAGTAPHVVLLDLNLPDCSDLRLLERVRRMAPSAAVVLMTAFGSIELRADALKLGATCVLDKPFELEQLVALMSRLTTAH